MNLFEKPLHAENPNNMNTVQFNSLTLCRIVAVAFFLAIPLSSKSNGEGKNEKNQSKVEEIIVVCKTHFDIGFTHQIDEVIPYYRTTMIDNALEVMDKSKDLPPEQQFIWTAPGWVMSKVLEDWDGQSVDRRQKLEESFRSGRFITHALPFTYHSDIMSPEEFARGMVFSADVSKKYGLPIPRAAKLTDVPSHTSALATGLAQSGVDFLHIGCNWPSGAVDYPGLFWWEGPDGSRLLTLYSSIYSSGTALWPKDWGGNKGEDHPGVIGTNFLPPKDWPHKAWLAILVTPDNTGPPSAKALKPLFDEVAEKMPGVKIRMGKMEDFADAILSSDDEIPVIKKEAPDTWIHGVMSDPRGIKLYRNLQTQTLAAEELSAYLRMLDQPVNDNTGIIDKAYEQILLYAEHTWGRGISVYLYGDKFHNQPADKYKVLEGSWDDKSNYVYTAHDLVSTNLASELEMLADAVNVEGSRLVVYNPLPWKRSEMVKLPGSENNYFYAKDVPAGGHKTFAIEKKDKNTQFKDLPGNSIENEFYKITFDPGRGIITSFIEKNTGRNWVNSDAEQGLGQYMNERFTLEQTEAFTAIYQNGRSLGCFGYPEDVPWLHPGIYKEGMVSDSIIPYRSASPLHGRLVITGNKRIQKAVMTMPGDLKNHIPKTELHVTLASGMPYVDLEIKILEKHKDNWPEADWLCLPFKIENPTFALGRALGTINPETDLLPGSNRHLFAVGSGVTITGSDGAGIAICPTDHPLVSLGQPGIWKSSRDFVPEKPVVYLNLYNNMWNTNFRYWYTGDWSSRVRIWTFSDNPDNEHKFLVRSQETRAPMLSVRADGGGGDLPGKYEGISCSRKGVEISALRKSADSDELLLRVWEKVGKSGKLEIHFPSELNISKAQPVNFRGEKNGDIISVSNHTLNIDLGKYAPASFILKH